MLDSKTLHDFLTANVHDDLYPQLFVISRKGKLVAYSTTNDISGIESEAALVAMIWREHSKSPSTSKSADTTRAQPGGSNSNSVPLKALTVESHSHNILVRPIQANMLLVLVGGIPPGMSRPFKVVPEFAGDKSYAAGDGDLERQVVALTSGSEAPHTNLHALRLQRRKLDVLAETIMAEAKVVKVPDDS